MATLKTRALFFTTSPRSPVKTIPEIRLLIENFENKEWNKDTQVEYLKLLVKSTFFQGRGSDKEPTFSSRDRVTRAPKALGFLELEPVVKLTEQGKRFIYGDDPQKPYTEQLMKYQLPSPFHKESDVVRGQFCIRPFLELLRLVNDLEYITMDEIIIFFMPFIDYHSYQSLKESIVLFRESVQKSDNPDALVDEYKTNSIHSIYASEIKSGRTEIRGKNQVSLSKFVKTKLRNLRDYADALIRYISFTKLVLVDGRGRSAKLIVDKKHIAAVNTILSTTPRDPVYVNQDTKFKEYLFNK